MQEQPFKSIMQPFWLVAWSVALSIAWLLPNHYLPWAGFHFDFWTACVMSMACAAVIVRSGGGVPWHAAAVLAALLIAMPGLQFAAGLITLSGTAWINTAYLLGLLLALLAGAKWESTSPGQLADGLFLAIGLASIVSVGLQLHQWLQLGTLEVWVMPDKFGRPFANFGQPNQLATFLLWGLIALGWSVIRGYMRSGTALFVALYLVFGLALTRSRTAWLAVALLLALVWLFRRRWPRNLPWVVTGLAAYLVVCTVGLEWVSELLLLPPKSDAYHLVRASTETRPDIWRMFSHAALQRPWFGYGWGQAIIAQWQVALDQPQLRTLFSHAHNIFLDLILWCGIPVGLVVSAGLVIWLWNRIRAVQTTEDALLVLFILVAANHAMLELPLHYAYILLPVALVAGALHVRLGSRVLFTTARWPFAAAWVVAVALLALIVRDYARIEPAFQSLRFEWAGIKTPKTTPPDVLLLNQWSAFVRLAKTDPAPGMPAEDLEWMRQATRIHPGPAQFQNMALALALNGNPEEAGLWLRRLCGMVPARQCGLVERVWANMSKLDARVAAVPWPQ